MSLITTTRNNSRTSILIPMVIHIRKGLFPAQYSLTGAESWPKTRITTYEAVYEFLQVCHATKIKCTTCLCEACLILETCNVFIINVMCMSVGCTFKPNVTPH